MIFKRSHWAWLHRWAGLVMAGFLILVGLTGSLLAFYPELERLINPQFYPERTAGEKLDFATLAARAEILAPAGWINGIFLEANQENTLVAIGPGIDSSRFQQSVDLAFDQLTVDPLYWRGTGTPPIWRHFRRDVINFMPFIYQLPLQGQAIGSFGMWALGICALIWTIDCFVGLYLTYTGVANHHRLRLSL